MPLVVSSLHRYPVKSCRGESVAEAAVEPWGLAGDRRWMVTDPEGTFVTARARPRLVLVHPVVDAGGLTLHAPGVEPLRVPVPSIEPLEDVVVWRNRIKATSAGAEAAAWLSAFLGADLRLVHLDDPTRRPVDPEFGTAADRVSLADGYPVLVTSESSLAALNGWIAEGPNAVEGPVPMVRFRPNVVVSGTAPWAEDDWSLLRIGEARFRAVKPCGRCVLTTVDAETAVKGREPLATLARHRRMGAMIVFGMNLIPDDPGAVLRVGDEIKPLA
ncbi:MOSC domain-containing protein [Pseudonocardia xishanensis]|uniref:MOSC domain-containing protein n=1 Tax=Pseudonocardia xishanensis TaxID=630995 RepID=A0ABP8RIK3_9PSEU